MNSLRSILSILLAFVFATGIADYLHAQDARTEAVMSYNNARELAENKDFIDAIGLYQEALEIAESEGFDDIVDLVRAQIPRVYYSRATDAFQQFRNDRSVQSVDRAIEFFQDAHEAGNEYGDNQVASQSRAVIPQLHYNKSLVQYNNADHEGALESLDRAIELNANYTLAYYQKGIVLNNMDENNLEAVLEAFDQAIEVGNRVGDTENVDRSERRARAELVYQGVQAMDNNRISRALELLQRAAEYEPNHVDVNYRLAEVYNKRQNWSAAVEHARRALEFDTGGVADKAKIYFELGTGYQGQGMKTEACNAFENAAYGEFRDPALHILEYELECEGYANAGRR